ncbi:MAG: hypothetical protein A3F13_06910 [Gammaproteobacteria bacterium RIFCSPHIGHO2_12_FULL_40_19]|nr:MAG: hypothetical protein A3F13_06910 [Gammaproteobacteria bacterium RIFCSPHIGHO2_12_FULL_40_19]
MARTVNDQGELPLSLCLNDKTDDDPLDYKTCKASAIDSPFPQIYSLLLPLTCANPLPLLLTQPIEFSTLLETYKPTTDGPLYQHLKIGCEAANFARNILTKSCTHPDSNLRPWSYVKEDSKLLNNARFNFWVEEGIKQETYTSLPAQTRRMMAYKNIGIGDCREHSDIVFYYLTEKKQTVQCDWLGSSNGDHAFILIGRDPASDPTKPATWGKNAVICDAWAGIISPADQQHILTYKEFWSPEEMRVYSSLPIYNANYHQFELFESAPTPTNTTAVNVEVSGMGLFPPALNDKKIEISLPQQVVNKLQ